MLVYSCTCIFRHQPSVWFLSLIMQVFLPDNKELNFIPFTCRYNHITPCRDSSLHYVFPGGLNTHIQIRLFNQIIYQHRCVLLNSKMGLRKTGNWRSWEAQLKGLFYWHFILLKIIGLQQFLEKSCSPLCYLLFVQHVYLAFMPHGTKVISFLAKEDNMSTFYNFGDLFYSDCVYDFFFSWQ